MPGRVAVWRVSGLRDKTARPMQLEQIARSILFENHWEGKLFFDENFQDTPTLEPLTQPPRLPGRPGFLKKIGKAEFPKSGSLIEASSRGRLLHFFANHELLAMELMALMLLRFPDAPTAFRAGIARTIHEEQNHLRLYVERMNQLGVGFGDLPLSDYFWNAMKAMESPLQFVTQMSLTLEQANLDFSLSHQKAVAEVGDDVTASILQRVYLEEIGHVKHGLTWFNRFREKEFPDHRHEDDWEAYLRLLPPPMTPRRAKGVEFSADSRREAGLSERFIQELEVYGGSKGRPPQFWIYNPFCDSEIARGKPGFTPSQKAQQVSLDLQTIPLFLALESDVLLVDELPRAEWLREMKALGFVIPEFRKKETLGKVPRENKLSGIQPWGWSPDPFERFKPWEPLLIAADGGNGSWCREVFKNPSFEATGLGNLFSKAWSTRFLSRWRQENPSVEGFGDGNGTGEVFSDWKAARERIQNSLALGQTLLAKAPFGTSGIQNKRILEAKELESSLGAWIQNTMASQGAMVIEPWLNKIADFSLQIEVLPTHIRTLGIRRFVVGPQLDYRGTYLDAKLATLTPAVLRFLHSANAPLEQWQRFAVSLGESLRQHGYLGPAGLDGMVWKDDSGNLHLKPLVELNPRWTMGRIALELETHLSVRSQARWLFLPVRELEARGLPTHPAQAAEVLLKRHPLRLEKGGAHPRLAGGVIFTTDPTRAQEVLTLLVAGSSALADPALRF